MGRVKHEAGRKITTPSQFGSHKSMVIDPPEGLTIPEGLVLCKDDVKTYLTEEWRLDCGLADPNRCGQGRYESLLEQLSKGDG